MKEFEAIMEGMAESVLEASDEAILEDAREAGEDLEATAAVLRSRLLHVVNVHKRERLLAARRAREHVLSELEKSRASLPTSRAERRALLDAVLSQHSEVRGRLTAQYRDLKQLSDEDVESCLQHLLALGVLGNSESD